MKLLPLPRSKVTLGTPLPWNVRDSNTVLLLSRGHVVEDEHQLDAILQRGAFVDVEEIKAAASLHIAISQGATPTQQVSLCGLWEQTTADVVKLKNKEPHMPELPSRVAEFSSALIAPIDKDVDVALYRTVRQEKATACYYGYDHVAHGAILGLLIARHLQWPEARCLRMVNAAITKNMPILALQGKMADQEDPVKDSQRAIIRKHPQESVDWLEAAGVTDPEWLAAVEQHHDRADGTGYPKGVTEINDMATVLPVVDVFMGKITPRGLRPVISVKDAARQLYAEDHGGPMLEAVVKDFGIYPPGELVKLTTGEIAVVMRRNNNAKCPIVAAITDETGKSMVKTVQRDTSQAAYAFVSNVADKSLVARMPPERIYGYAKA